MTARNAIPVFLAALLGFLLGVMFTHQTPVEAQSGLQVYITNDNSPGFGSLPTSVPGSHVVGFSCVQQREDDSKCFVASVK
jgi:hypothetical protein